MNKPAAPRSQAWKQRVRSVQGQLALLAVTYAGALGLVVLALVLRTVLFERYVREKFEPMPAPLQAAAQRIASGQQPADSVMAFNQKEDGLLYGALLQHGVEDPEHRLADALAHHRPRWLLDQVRGTLVAGSLPQRQRALDLLCSISAEPLRPEMVRLCEFCCQRATVRGEPAMLDRARDLIRDLQHAEKTK
jgi:hypothetical protein